MIVACELGMIDGAHGPVNAGMLATIRAAFPEEDVLFVGGSTHIEEVKKQLGSELASSVSWKSISAPGPGVAYGRRFMRELKIIWQLLRALRLQHPRCLFLTSSYPSTLLAAKLIER